jgi:hypothetical protein
MDAMCALEAAYVDDLRTCLQQAEEVSLPPPTHIFATKEGGGMVKEGSL